MIDFLKQWLRAQASFFFWTYVPLIITVIFAMLMVHHFPSIAIPLIGIFFVLMAIFVFWIKRPR
ncbi:hypothetical protein [Brenneria goodwinii]|uniref:hypothetical protein n=1 Tax=Brenneria goodwinii TaxID=1109412 RepID=UPI000BAF108D|nr:hypothetical protein [Brenneria goodwinii]